MNQKELQFQSRVDLWRAYRDEIAKDASKISINEGKKIQKYKKDIRAIDPSILEAMNTDVKISSGINADVNFRDKYSKLVFSMEGVDERLLDELNSAASKANELKDKEFVITKDYELIDLQLPRDIKAKETFDKLDSQIAELSNAVQHFPDNAKESLYILNESIQLAKSKSEPIASDEKVSLTAIPTSRDLKWPYFLSFGGALLALLVIIIMIICIMVLW